MERISETMKEEDETTDDFLERMRENSSPERIMERIEKQMKEEKEIRCPHCGKVQNDYDCSYLVSYWGEDGPYEVECSDCEQTFYVIERVRRSYEEGKSIDEWGNLIKK